MGVTARAGALRILDYTDTTIDYVAVGDPLDHAASIFTLSNLTDADMMFSLDGDTDQFYLKAQSSYVEDITANRAGNDSGLYIPKGTQVWVKMATGNPASLGNVNVMFVYDSSN